MMKGQKGITLVALIITIIVMLILVGVSISVALNGGLFQKADDAVEGTKTAQLQEAIALVQADIYAMYYDPDTTTETPYGADEVAGMINEYLAGSKIALADTDVEFDQDPDGSTYTVKAPTGVALTSGNVIKLNFWKETTP